MMEELKEKIRTRLIGEYNRIFGEGIPKEEKLREAVEKIIDDLSQHRSVLLTSEQKSSLIEELIDELSGFGPLKTLLTDPSVTEIMVNGPKKIYVERHGKKQLSDIVFESEGELRRIIQRMLLPTMRRVDETHPYTDISLPDGSRVNIILPPLSLVGPVVTIRKFSQQISKIDDLLELDTLNEKMARFLIAAIKSRLNIIFSGATGAGKTTTLNILSSYIPEQERIITIEDTAELRLNQEHVIRLEARFAGIEGKGEVTIRNLFKNSLRMRPDRIILGEIRGAESLDMLQAIASGHGGSLSVIHANSPQDVIARLEAMVLAAGLNLSLWVVRKYIASSIDIILHHEQLLDGSRKITHITEVRGIENQEVCLKDLFSFDIERIDNQAKVIGRWKAQGVEPLFYSKFQKAGIDLPRDIFK